MKKSILIIGIITLLSSCYTSNYTVGEEMTTKTETTQKGKTIWLFWGLVNVSDPDFEVLDDSYLVVRKTKFIDGLITAVTGGIVTFKTVAIKTEKDEKM